MSSEEPSLTLDDAKRVVEGLDHPRVTEESIKDKIAFVEYISIATTTICVINMDNGFKVIGHSTPASPHNYRIDVGKRYAYENAFKQLWQLEGYLLCEKLRAGRQTEPRLS